MKTYIGTKIINAQPMSRKAYNDFRGWVVPTDEDGNDDGYLVEYTDGGKPNTTFYNGYVSWSPKEQFEKAYKSFGSGLPFGDAIAAIKQGARAQRAGWNGKDMWITYSPGGHITAEQFWAPANRAYATQLGGAVKVLPSITFKTATGEILMGWLASQTDMLADDWLIL